jgi:hypothetical protein
MQMAVPMFEFKQNLVPDLWKKNALARLFHLLFAKFAQITIMMYAFISSQGRI